jgi:hypothetical protein
MKCIPFLCICAASWFSCFAQTNSPSVIISSGTFTQGEEASLSWTIGEDLVESYGNEDLMLLQGFLETEDYLVPIEENTFEDEGILIFPTRTHAVVNVLINKAIDEAYTGNLVDMSGKVLSIVELPAHHNEISLLDFPYGLYMLKITRGKDPVTEVKIIRF